HRAQDVDRLALDDGDVHVALATDDALEGGGQRGLQGRYILPRGRETSQLRDVHAAALVDLIVPRKVHAREHGSDEVIRVRGAVVDCDAEALEERYLEPVAIGEDIGLSYLG